MERGGEERGGGGERERLNHIIKTTTRSIGKTHVAFRISWKVTYFPLHRNTKEGAGGKHSPSLTKREPSGFDKLETIQVCATVVTLCKCHFPLASEAKISKLTPSHGLGVIPYKMTTNNFIINKLAQKSSPS